MIRVVQGAVIGMVLVLVGAGCGNVETGRVEGSATSSPGTPTRVDVPELGFSYVPYADEAEVPSRTTVHDGRLSFSLISPQEDADFIERIPRAEGQGFEQAVTAFMKTHGGDPSRCRVEVSALSADRHLTWLRPGTLMATLVPTEPLAAPTPEQLRAHLQRTSNPNLTKAEFATLCETTPACVFAEQDLAHEGQKAACGEYASDPHPSRVSVFVADAKDEGTVLYVQGGGAGDVLVFGGGPIEFRK